MISYHQVRCSYTWASGGFFVCRDDNHHEYTMHLCSGVHILREDNHRGAHICVRCGLRLFTGDGFSPPALAEDVPDAF